MARDFHERIRVSGVLETIDAFHVGSGADDVLTDMPLAEDGQGRYFIPGTSIAGALRQWCEERFARDDEDVKKTLLNPFWGDVGQSEADPGAASWILIEDAVLLGEKPTGAKTSVDGDLAELRDHVGIDREWGAAAAAIKFDRTVLPAGVCFQFHMTLTVPTAEREKVLHDSAPGILGHLVQTLESGQLRLGGGKTRGLGRVRLLDAKITSQTRDLQGLLGRLRDRLPDARAALETAAKGVTVKPYHRLKIAIDWEPVGPIMVKAGVDGLRVDAVPMLAGTHSASGVQFAPVIPGSSLKGALRSHAERIWQTVTNGKMAEPKDKSSRARFEAQMTDESVQPVLQLFGRQTLSSKKDKNIEEKNAAGWQSALSVADCIAENGRSRERWGEMFYEPQVKDPQQNLQKFRLQQAQLGRTEYEQSMHVAIDRFTGGAAENLLFSTLEPLGEDWPDFELELDVTRLQNITRKNANSQKSSVIVPWMLLLFTLRDLVKGRLPIGFGGNRGFGEVAVRKIVITRLEGTGKCDDPSGLEDLPTEMVFPVTNGKLDVSTCSVDLMDLWRGGWQAALKESQP